MALISRAARFAPSAARGGSSSHLSTSSAVSSMLYRGEGGGEKLGEDDLCIAEVPHDVFPYAFLLKHSSSCCTASAAAGAVAVVLLLLHLRTSLDVHAAPASDIFLLLSLQQLQVVGVFVQN